MIHGLLVDGHVQRSEVDPLEIDAELDRLRENGHSAVFIFSAVTEQEFQRKKREEEERTGPQPM